MKKLPILINGLIATSAPLMCLAACNKQPEFVLKYENEPNNLALDGFSLDKGTQYKFVIDFAICQRDADWKWDSTFAIGDDEITNFPYSVISVDIDGHQFVDHKDQNEPYYTRGSMGWFLNLHNYQNFSTDSSKINIYAVPEENSKTTTVFWSADMPISI